MGNHTFTLKDAVGIFSKLVSLKQNSSASHQNNRGGDKGRRGRSVPIPGCVYSHHLYIMPSVILSVLLSAQIMEVSQEPPQSGMAEHLRILVLLGSLKPEQHREFVLHTMEFY